MAFERQVQICTSRKMDGDEKLKIRLVPHSTASSASAGSPTSHGAAGNRISRRLCCRGKRSSRLNLLWLTLISILTWMLLSREWQWADRNLSVSVECPPSAPVQKPSTIVHVSQEKASHGVLVTLVSAQDMHALRVLVGVSWFTL